MCKVNYHASPCLSYKSLMNLEKQTIQLVKAVQKVNVNKAISTNFN